MPLPKATGFSRNSSAFSLDCRREDHRRLIDWDCGESSPGKMIWNLKFSTWTSFNSANKKAQLILISRFYSDITDNPSTSSATWFLEHRPNIFSQISPPSASLSPASGKHHSWNLLCHVVISVIIIAASEEIVWYLSQQQRLISVVASPPHTILFWRISCSFHCWLWSVVYRVPLWLPCPTSLHLNQLSAYLSTRPTHSQFSSGIDLHLFRYIAIVSSLSNDYIHAIATVLDPPSSIKLSFVW